MSGTVDTAETFRKALTLTEVAASIYDRAFTATPQYVPWPKAYGGDTLAQAAAAAMATVDRDRVLHSVHSSFLRPVDIYVEVRYEVELVRDGRGYSTRHVRGFQHGKAVVLSTASFQSHSACRCRTGSGRRRPRRFPRRFSPCGRTSFRMAASAQDSEG